MTKKEMLLAIQRLRKSAMEAKVTKWIKIGIVATVPGALPVYAGYKLFGFLRRKYVRTTNGSDSK